MIRRWCAVRSVDRYLGNQSQLESSSTDANVPLSMGIPAIAIGERRTRRRDAHARRMVRSLGPRDLGLKRLFLTILALAGLES